MQKFMLLILLTVASTVVFAQKSKPVAPKQEISDPEAKAVLEKMRKKYEAYGTLEVEFSLEIEVPQQAKQTQKGILSQQGEKSRLKLNDRTMVSDGKSVWLHIPKNQEVQINDVEDDEEIGRAHV